ncbi:MAG: hypothetical protein C0407_08180 [Desulfobacca sp.]|nr:hypothetical protein [Desulfobacca sp.]
MRPFQCKSLLILVSFVLSLSLLFSGPVEPGNLKVPNLVSQGEIQARKTLEQAGFRVEIAALSTSIQSQQGIILKQDPPGGSEIPSGGLVKLSSGRYQPTVTAQVQVPNVIGMKLEQARQVLTQTGFQVQGKFEPSTRQEDDNKVIGISNPITGQTLVAGQKLNKNTLVHLTILQVQPSQKPSQSGGEPKIPTGQSTMTGTMPNVVGLPFTEAARRIISLGLLVKVPPEQMESTDPNLNDKVAQQNPAVGQPYPPNKNVVLKVHKFSNRLPDVMGLPLEEAKRRLEAMGLKVSLNPPLNTGDKTQDGKVGHQYPPGGGPFPDSRVIALAQYKFDAATLQTQVPNVMGLRLQDAQNVLAKKGLQFSVHINQQTKDKNQTDKIFGQSPNPGASVARNTTVILSQYLYSPADTVTVPNVVGLTVDKALQALKNSGLVAKHYVMKPIDGTELQPSYLAINKVSSQNPAAGTAMNPIFRVELKTMYEGPIPNVVGMDQVDAHWVLGSCGILYVKKFEKAPVNIQPPPRTGVIFFQDPRPGGPLTKGSPFVIKAQWP